jgi:hypothetical protein
MKTLESFKKELGLKEIPFMYSEKKDRHFCTIKAGTESIDIIIGKDTDVKKELFIFLNEDKGIFIVCNSTLKKGVTL